MYNNLNIENMKTVILDFDGTLDKACTTIKAVKETLKEMYAMGVTLALTSKKEQEILENTLDDLNLSNYFSVIVSADNAKTIETDNDMVQVVLDDVNKRNGTDYQQKDVYFDFEREVITNASDNASIKKIEADIVV